jgi:hypothetical protein
MSGAQSWSVKGIDPKVREAAREAAARQGMSLGEYLNQALASGQLGGGGARRTAATPQQPRARRAARLVCNMTTVKTIGRRRVTAHDRSDAPRPTH